jgi:TolB-like protein/DNA-binding winged helix-turn-helix (wHTH) protein
MNDILASAGGRQPIRLSEIADFSLGDLRIRPSLREVERGGKREQLEPRVMQVLVALAAAAGAVVSRDDLIARCWEGRIVGEAAINRCISILREIAESTGAFTIETIPRVGYRLISSAAAVRPTEEVDKAPPPEPAPKARFARNSPYVWVAAAVLAMIAVAAAVYKTGIHPTVPPTSFHGPVQASIAVLPFKNLSSDRNTGYLAEGVQDEILTRLAKIGSLKVISRTSTEEFATHSPNIREIARKLGVANVLEGNVQKAGDRIRINVQLIRAANEDHLWAEDYDRSLDDVFSVESDVAGAIARALAAKVTPLEHAEIAAKPTSNPRAYDLYLRALVFGDKNDHTSLETASELLTEATQLDPKFALAWARLARNEAYRHFGYDLATVRKGAAHAALARALALQPDLAETQAAKGFYLYYAERNYPAAERQLRFVNARWPNNAEGMEALALILRRQGKWKESLDVLERLVRLDPLSEHHRVLLAGGLVLLRDYAQSLAVLDAALQIWPDDEVLLANKAGVLFQLGQVDAAAAVLKNVHPGPDDDNEIGAVAYHFWLKRQYLKGAAFFRGLLAMEQQGDNRDSVTCTLRMAIGEYLRMAGDAAGARENYLAALRSVQNELKARPDDVDFLGLLPPLYAGLGQDAKALALAEENIRRLRASHDALVLVDAEDMYAHLDARLGNRSDAITVIFRLLKSPAYITPAILRLDPDFDRLRGDPHFEALTLGSDVAQAN